MKKGDEQSLPLSRFFVIGKINGRSSVESKRCKNGDLERNLVLVKWEGKQTCMGFGLKLKISCEELFWNGHGR